METHHEEPERELTGPEVTQYGRFREEFVYKGRLGRGGFGYVFKAEHKIDEKCYAVKRIEFADGDEMRNFVKEVKHLASLHHKHIVGYNTAWVEYPPQDWQEEEERHYLDLSGSSQSSTGSSSTPGGSTGRYLYIQMELCKMKTLRHRIDEDSLGDEDSKFHIFQDILAGVEYLHIQVPKLMHRDLKPANILFSGDETVKISDFGLAKPLEGDDHTERVGTYSYRAPEMLGSSYTHKVDIYALGIILFELVHPPFPSQMGRANTLQDLRKQMPVFPNTFKEDNTDVCDLVSKMLCHNPDDRLEVADIMHYLSTKILKREMYMANADSKAAGATTNYIVLKDCQNIQIGEGNRLDVLQGIVKDQHLIYSETAESVCQRDYQEHSLSGFSTCSENASSQMTTLTPLNTDTGNSEQETQLKIPSSLENTTRLKTFPESEETRMKIVYSRSYDSKTQVKGIYRDIETDEPPDDEYIVSLPLLKGNWEDIILYEYQAELREKALTGENTIISAPTGSGKTVIALHIAKEHLSKNKSHRVVFLAPTNPLVEQQSKFFDIYLSKVKGTSGRNAKAAEIDIPVRELIKGFNVTVMTPQILLNNLKANSVTLSEFSLLIVDECHRCHGGDPYNQIMAIYRDQKMTGHSRKSQWVLPQIVGLTASLGTGGSDSTLAARNHILKIMANLDVLTQVCQVVQHTEQLQHIVTEARENTYKVPLRENDLFKDVVVKLMTLIEKDMKKYGNIACPQIPGNTIQYVNWLRDIEEGINLSDSQHRDFLQTAVEFLNIYHTSLLLNEDCSSMEAFIFLQNKLDGRDFRKNEQYFYDIYKDHITDFKTLDDKKYSNPKLEMLRYLLLKQYEKKAGFCCLVFVRTRLLTERLKHWMQEDEQLKEFNPGSLTGVGEKASDGGMSSAAQRELMKMFSEGKHQVVFSTSIGEEGLDIPICNLVIRYEHSGSEIARIQARGRGRAKGARFVVISGENRKTAEQEQRNKELEGVMKEALQLLSQSDSGKLKKEIWQMQEDDLTDRKHRENTERKVKESKSRELHRLLCKRCKKVVLTSEEIYTYETLHIPVKEGFYDDVVRIDKRDKTEVIGNGVIKIGKIYHSVPYGEGSCDYDLGGVQSICKVRVAALKAASFLIETPLGGQSILKKWKSLPFEVKKIDLEDMPEYSFCPLI